MTGALVHTIAEPQPCSVREAAADHFVELLECLAELRVLDDQRRAMLTAAATTVASVHQTLQHEHLI